MQERHIRLPWPSTRQNPNASKQGSWRAKSEAAKTYKSACVSACDDQAVRPVLANEVAVEVTFCPPSLRKYDLDNRLASIKQGLDAVAEAIGVDDADWRSMALVRGKKVKGGCVLVHVRAAE